MVRSEEIELIDFIEWMYNYSKVSIDLPNKQQNNFINLDRYTIYNLTFTIKGDGNLRYLSVFDKDTSLTLNFMNEYVEIFTHNFYISFDDISAINFYLGEYLKEKVWNFHLIKSANQKLYKFSPH